MLIEFLKYWNPGSSNIRTDCLLLPQLWPLISFPTHLLPPSPPPHVGSHFIKRYKDKKHEDSPQEIEDTGKTSYPTCNVPTVDIPPKDPADWSDHFNAPGYSKDKEKLEVEHLRGRVTCYAFTHHLLRDMLDVSVAVPSGADNLSDNQDKEQQIDKDDGKNWKMEKK